MTQLTVKAKDKTSQATNNRWEQIGAAGGIAFVVLQLIGQSLIQVGGSEPAFDAPAGEIVTFFMNRNVMLAGIGGYFSILSVVAFFGFIGALWAELSRYEGERGWLSLVAFACGVTGIATTLGGGGWELAMLRIDEGLEAQVMQLLFDQGNYAFANLWVCLAGMLLATAVIAIRDGALPRWLGWSGLVLAVAFLAARAVWFTASGIKFTPYALFWAWLIAASLVLIRRASHGPG
jgi:hypothetical protein